MINLSGARLRRWLPLACLTFGIIAAFIGGHYGCPNSWLWFGGGVVAALVIALLSRQRVRRSRADRSDQ